jgi:hypothetical protein
VVYQDFHFLFTAVYDFEPYAVVKSPQISYLCNAAAFDMLLVLVSSNSNVNSPRHTAT